MRPIQVANDNEIVVVDDDEMELDIFRRFLKRSELRNPLRAFQYGDDFLRHMEEVYQGIHPMPAIALIDVRMPVMSGFEVVQSVRSNPFFEALPLIVMFSNSDQPSDMDRAKEVGADLFQVKPDGASEYINFINSLARQDA